MESYYRVSDVKAIIKKLLKEPAYYHDDKDFVVGVCTVGSELACLDILELEEPKEATRGLHLGNYYYCSNCGKLASMENYCSMCGAKVKKVEYE
jgi:hypothetical protein